MRQQRPSGATSYTCDSERGLRNCAARPSGDQKAATPWRTTITSTSSPSVRRGTRLPSQKQSVNPQKRLRDVATNHDDDNNVEGGGEAFDNQKNFVDLKNKVM